ncbi:aldo/keto reductase [Phenylobacterium sp. J367]|uniref:aldo/keto reductase n=1 Tax=Phenylobacterium sp. J367 TaxID=2898435 RepID=UPI002151D929|nr:aldo/keto reductase [Phenylobacterium sp. J367]MCR5879557.1 aldo/keto reductase [Phenylobacterium sp. J367]
MKFNRLGRTDLEVSPLCFGGNVFGWTIDEPTSFRLLDQWVDAGMNFIDTADAYSTWVEGNAGGESETIIGRWLKARGRRDDVVIATKVGMEMPGGKKGLSRAYINEAIEASLRRLQTDYVDLYQSHFDDPETPFEETLAAYEPLIRAGKVRAIGASNLTAERLAESLRASSGAGLPRYESLQPLYNLHDREEFEGPLEDLCRAEGIGVINYWSLASGFLTGKYRSEADLGKSPRGERVAKYLDARGLRILGALDAIAAEAGATPGQVALAWLIARPSVTSPIASATTPGQLAELVAAAELKLDAAAIARLDAASAPARAAAAEPA